jgi:hypothetical protein
VIKRLKLTGISLLAFTSVGFVVASASAQGGGTAPPAPTTTDTAPPPPTPTTTSTTTTTAQPSAPAAVAQSEGDEVPALFQSKYTPEQDKASTEKPTAAWRWSGSEYFQQFGVTPGTFAPGLTQTPESIVDTFILFQPRFALTKDWQVRVRIVASYEFTDNSYSTTTRANEFSFGDITPSLAFTGIPKFAGIKITPSFGLSLPVSPVSQARSMIVSPLLSLSVNKTFEKVLKGELSFTGIVQYSHPFYQYTTAGLNDVPQYQPACFGAGDTCDMQASGAANPENNLNFGIIAGWQWGKFSIGALYYLFNSWVYQFGALAGVESEPGGSVPFRQLSYFNASLGWDFNSFFTAEVGYQMYRSILTGESTIGNPIWDPNQDMRIYAGATVKLDKLYDTLRGVKEPEKGVVHVQNERKPNPEAL